MADTGKLKRLFIQCTSNMLDRGETMFYPDGDLDGIAEQISLYIERMDRDNEEARKLATEAEGKVAMSWVKSEGPTSPLKGLSKERKSMAGIEAKCVACGHRETIRAGEVPDGDHPMCSNCFSPMVAIRATSEPEETPKLSTGDPSTLGNYLALSKAVFGEDSDPVKFLQAEVDRSPNGEAEVVVQAENQMVQLLGQLFGGEMDVDKLIRERAGLDG